MAPDHRFSKVRSGGPTDQRVALQHVNCSDEVFNARWGVRRLMLKEIFQYETVGSGPGPLRFERTGALLQRSLVFRQTTIRTVLCTTRGGSHVGLTCSAGIATFDRRI